MDIVQCEVDDVQYFYDKLKLSIRNKNHVSAFRNLYVLERMLESMTISALGRNN
jgi:hypothetical protein